MHNRPTGTPPNERQRGTLAPRFPRTENLLAGIPDFEITRLDEVRRFCNAMITARDAWADANRSRRRYSDPQKARAFGTVFKTGGAR